jgi:ketosteroid isomerase-like protein
MIRKSWITFFVVGFALFAIGWRAARSAALPENATEEILKVDEERNQALQKGDIATLDRIYSDDLVYANATGALLTKAQHLADLKAKGLHFLSFKHDDVKVVVHGDTGMVTGISTSEVEYHGAVSSSPRRFLNVFVKKDGRWLCVAHFETPVQQKP